MVCIYVYIIYIYIFMCICMYVTQQVDILFPCWGEGGSVVHAAAGITSSTTACKYLIYYYECWGEDDSGVHAAAGIKALSRL